LQSVGSRTCEFVYGFIKIQRPLDDFFPGIRYRSKKAIPFQNGHGIISFHSKGDSFNKMGDSLSKNGNKSKNDGDSLNKMGENRSISHETTWRQ
jgi:hypothetical protein